jgi:hypothetical protein
MPGSAFAHALQTLQEQPAHLRLCVERGLTASENQERALYNLASPCQDRPEQAAGPRLTLRLSGGEQLHLLSAAPVQVRAQEWSEDDASHLPTAEFRLFIPDRSGSSLPLSAFPACTGASPETARRPDAGSVYTNRRDPAGHDASVRHPRRPDRTLWLAEQGRCQTHSRGWTPLPDHLAEQFHQDAQSRPRICWPFRITCPRKQPADSCRTTTCEHTISVARGDAPVPSPFAEQEERPMRLVVQRDHPAGARMTLAWTALCAGWN